MMHALEFKIEVEQIYDVIAPVISDTSLQKIKTALSELKKQAPSLDGDACQPIHTIPDRLDVCQNKIHRLLSRLSWLRSTAYMQGIMLSRYKHHEKENEILKEENKQLQKKLTKSKKQIQQLLGVKEKPEDTNKENSEKEEKTETDNTPSKKRGAPKGHRGNTRLIPSQIDNTKIITPPEQCPSCQHQDILYENDFIDKYIEDIPDIIKTVTKLRYQRGRCKHCGESVIDEAATQGPPVIIGNNLKTALTVLRQQMGVSLRKLSRFCQDVCQIELSAAGVQGILSRVSLDLQPAYTSIETALPLQSILHADETGWKMNGERWYLWTFCNKHLSYFHADKSRSAQIPKTILGEDYSGLLHSDFYGAYNCFSYTQKCLVHFLRDIKTELSVTKDDKSLILLKQYTKQIIEEGKIAQQQTNKKTKEKALKKLAGVIQKICRLESQNKETQTLIKRVIKYQGSLINFIHHPDANFHNNRAEQMIRPAVIFRKISFGNRTAEGARDYAILSSVLETCRINNISLRPFIKDMISQPPDRVSAIIQSQLKLKPQASHYINT